MRKSLLRSFGTFCTFLIWHLEKIMHFLSGSGATVSGWSDDPGFDLLETQPAIVFERGCRGVDLFRSRGSTNAAHGR